jgi:aminopeptidase N
MICDPRPLNENLARDEAAARALVVSTHDYRLHLDFSNAAAQDEPSFAVHTEVDFDATPGADTFLDYLGHQVDSVILNGDELAGGRVRPRRGPHPPARAEGTQHGHRGLTLLLLPLRRRRAPLR